MMAVSRRLWATFAVAGGLNIGAVAAGGAARAQQVTPPIQPFEPAASSTPARRGTAVRRAVPVAADTPAAEPPVARAVPFDPPVAAPPSRPAPPVPDAAADPGPQIAQSRSGRGPAPAPTASDGDSDTDIRIAPQAPGGPTASPDEVQFNLANDFYVRKQYVDAAAQYERYLGLYPDGVHRQAALWWLGESYRILGRPNPARSSYQNLLIAFREGEFVGPASFRLATMDFQDKDYSTALPLFQRSATLAKTADVRLSSRYFEALCLEKLDRRDETREVYNDILSVTGDNPYREDARLALARLAVAEKHPNDAFKQYEALSREVSKPALQAECSLRAGLLARELGQNDTAAVLLARAVGLPGASASVRADAQLAELHLFYDTNKYQRLLDTYASVSRELPPSSLPEAMMLAANSQRQLGKHTEARAVYDQIITQYPRSPQADEARYQRIVSLYAARDASFVKEADDFLLVNSDPVRTDQVRLMKADTLFSRGDYAGGATAYAAIDGATNLPPKYKAEAEYRLGFCYAQTKQPEKTAKAFSKFLKDFPEHPFAAKALVQRAVAYEQLQNLDGALADFNEVITDHKDAKERELAMEQKALILGQRGDTKGMTDAFHALLADYPKTDGAGVAYYSIAQAEFDIAKDYAAARASFASARKANPHEYGDRASLKIILCDYQLKDKDKLATEIEAYQKAKATPAVPSAILDWLGSQQFEAKEYAAAEASLAAAAASAPLKVPDTWLMLARVRLDLKKWDGALEAAHHYLESIPTEAVPRAEGLLVQGDAQLGAKRYDDAQKSADEVQELRPEGSLYAKARMLAGRIALARGEYEQAGKSFMSVAVLYDDPEITPAALRQAAEAFEKAGKPSEAAKAAEELKSRFPNATAQVP